MYLFGFVANRLNVAITGLEASSGVDYFPKWTEFMLSVATVTLAVVVFRYIVLHLKIFPRAETLNWAEIERSRLAAWTLSPQRPGTVRPTSRMS